MIASAAAEGFAVATVALPVVAVVAVAVAAAAAAAAAVVPVVVAVALPAAGLVVAAGRQLAETECNFAWSSPKSPKYPDPSLHSFETCCFPYSRLAGSEAFQAAAGWASAEDRSVVSAVAVVEAVAAAVAADLDFVEGAFAFAPGDLHYSSWPVTAAAAAADSVIDADAIA